MWLQGTYVKVGYAENGNRSLQSLRRLHDGGLWWKILKRLSGSRGGLLRSLGERYHIWFPNTFVPLCHEFWIILMHGKIEFGLDMQVCVQNRPCTDPEILQIHLWGQQPLVIYPVPYTCCFSFSHISLHPVRWKSDKYVGGSLTRAASGPLDCGQFLADDADYISKELTTHRTCESAQWKMTNGTSWVSFTSLSTLARNSVDGLFTLPTIWPPTRSSSRTSTTRKSFPDVRPGFFIMAARSCGRSLRFWYALVININELRWEKYISYPWISLSRCFDGWCI